MMIKKKLGQEENLGVTINMERQFFIEIRI